MPAWTKPLPTPTPLLQSSPASQGKDALANRHPALESHGLGVMEAA